MMTFKHLTVGLVLALAPMPFQAGCYSEARAATCSGNQCPPGDHDSLSDCYDTCDALLTGEYIFCDIVSPEYATKMICRAVARTNWSNCYRKCIK